MDEPRTTCRVCAISILQRTADRFGMCARCHGSKELLAELGAHYIYHVTPADTWRPHDLSAKFESLDATSMVEHDVVNVSLPAECRGESTRSYSVDTKIKFHPKRLVNNVTVKHDRNPLGPVLYPNGDIVRVAFEHCGYFAGPLNQFVETFFSNNSDVAAIHAEIQDLRLYEMHYFDNRDYVLMAKTRDQQQRLIESVGLFLS